MQREHRRFGGGLGMFTTSIAGMIAWVCTHLTARETVHVKYLQLVTCQSYLN